MPFASFLPPADSLKKPTASAALLLGALIAIAGLAGCGGQTPTPTRSDFQASTRSASAERLFETVVDTLNTLPESVNLELRPPMLVLDATNSKDRMPVLATVTRHPKAPNGPINFLYVHTRNSRFRDLADPVKPGDRVRYYILKDEFGTKSPIGIDVLKVLDNNSLLLADSLRQPMMEPSSLAVWRYGQAKVGDINTRLGDYASGRGPALGWEPSPDESAFEQIVGRLNQWSRTSAGEVAWKLDPLTETLPQRLKQYVAEPVLANVVFEPYDARLMQEAVWLRDVATWARDDALDNVEVASRLFDWTVRNIQLEDRDPRHDLRYRPWEVMMYGRGTAEERAWVFILLARQIGLDVVMLAIPDKDQPDTLREWLPALWSDGNLYLFDARLGLPILTADGKSVATLAQVKADQQLLRRLDLDAEHPYPVSAEDLDTVVALIEASPFHLSKRARLVEQRLVGKNKRVLTVVPSQLSERLKQSKALADVRLWELPFETIDEKMRRMGGDARSAKLRKKAAIDFSVYAWRPQLWKARVLHFQGEFLHGTMAKSLYQRARPGNSRIAVAKGANEKRLMKLGKMQASYDLGLLTFEDGDYDVAIDFLANRTLAATPDGPWTHGARYNLARVYEAQGQTQKAIELYEADDSPQSHGNKLRARRLLEQSKANAPAKDAPQENNQADATPEQE